MYAITLVQKASAISKQKKGVLYAIILSNPTNNANISSNYLQTSKNYV
jgi:hypothetical protein